MEGHVRGEKTAGQQLFGRLPPPLMVCDAFGLNHT
jgi:hypothetical protein